MSINYNEKFKQLREKIFSLSEENSEYSRNKTKYKNRLKYLELNSNQKIDLINKKFTSLKHDFISLNTIFIKNNNININKSLSFNKNKNSFYYPSLEKSEDDNFKLYIKNYSEKISNEISNNSYEIKNSIHSKFNELEKK